jgi:hypothetical protein
MKNAPDAPEALPEGFFARVLQEFGLQWTQVAIFSGAAFSSLRLTPYLDPAVWMLVTGAAFSLVYLFRRQVSNNFPKVTLIAAGTIAVCIGIPLAFGLSRGVEITRTLTTYRVPATVYIAMVVITPIAFMMLSYRKQETMFVGPYPKVLQDAISVNLADLKFYRENQIYSLAVTSLSRSTLVLRTTLSYTVVNRMSTPHKYTATFISPTGKVQYISATIGGQDVNVKDPDYVKERGLFIDRTIPPNGRLDCTFVAEETYPTRYSELFTAYAPATSLTVRLKNPHAQIAFNFESLLPEKVDAVPEDGDVVCRSAGGVLPFQGFRLHWSRSAATSTP